jgi:hypothetical protein
MNQDRAKFSSIDDLDRPLHRIFPLWRFEEVLRLRQLTLVKPSMWVDPREDLCSRILLEPELGASFVKPPRQLSDYLTECWAQCWSYEANSDVLLRAYSRVVLDPISSRNTTPAEEGVRVTTTARRIMSGMGEWVSKHHNDHFYLAGVTYEPEGKFGQRLANRLGKEGPRYFSTPDGRAESLCMKRQRFSHENEVRLLCVGKERLGTAPNIRRFEIDPNDLFTEIAFDPRLAAFERIERELWLRSAGYTGQIEEDDSYVDVIIAVSMQNEWEEPIE